MDYSDETPSRFANVRYNNPGAMYPGSAAQMFGSTGTGTIGGGHLIADFPTPVHGAAANMQNIINGGYVGLPIGAAIRKWSGNGRGTVPGFDTSTVITPEMTRDPEFMIPFMKSVASGEAPGQYPLSNDQWKQAFTWYANGAPNGEAMAYAGNDNAGGDGALNAIYRALKGKQNNMADNTPPSLAAKFLTGGPGALFGAPEQGYDLSRSLNNAAAWATSLDTGGKSLQALQNKDAFQLVSGADGSMYRVNQRTGQIVPITGPNPKVVDIGTDRAGNPIKGFQSGSNFFDFQGNRMSIGPNGVSTSAGGGGGGSGGIMGQDPFLAKGVKDVNEDITDPEEYLKQYSPDVQSYIKALAEGRQPSASNLRKGFMNVAQPAAFRYGDLTGTPMDVGAVDERRRLAKQLGDTANPSSFGGQRTATQTGINHLNDVLDAIDALGNSNGLGVKAISDLVNRPSDSKLISTDRQRKLAELLDKATMYAGERTKLLSGRAGGQEERQQIATQLFGGQMSDEALRGVVRQELGGLLGRVDPLERQLSNSTLTQSQKGRNQIIGPTQQKVIDEIMRRTAPGYTPPVNNAPATKFDKYYQ